MIQARFTTLDSARGYSQKTVKSSIIIMGDDGLYWVVNLATADWLIKRSYEAIQ